MWLSRDIRMEPEANRLLFAYLVADHEGKQIPAIPLSDIERRLEEIGITSGEFHSGPVAYLDKWSTAHVTPCQVLRDRCYQV